MSDGKDLLRRLRQILNEESGGGWLDTQASYDWLYDAAIEYVDRTGCLRATQTITTIAETAEYDINPDYLRLYLKNSDNNYYLKYNDGSNDHFLTWRDYEDIYYENNTDSVSVPSRFSIIDAALPTVLTGTATAVGAASGGQCTLTDAAADFTTVEAGSTVHNTTDASDGIVLSKTSTTALVVALFGGTGNDWTVADAYVIQPQARYQLIIDPLPSTAGHTITLPYIKRPSPVYSDYGMYEFINPQVLVGYAAWKYKYRDKEPNFGDMFWRSWENDIRRRGRNINQGQRRNTIPVNLKKRV